MHGESEESGEVRGSPGKSVRYAWLVDCSSYPSSGRMKSMWVWFWASLPLEMRSLEPIKSRDLVVRHGHDIISIIQLLCLCLSRPTPSLLAGGVLEVDLGTLLTVAVA